VGREEGGRTHHDDEKEEAKEVKEEEAEEEGEEVNGRRKEEKRKNMNIDMRPSHAHVCVTSVDGAKEGVLHPPILDGTPSCK